MVSPVEKEWLVIGVVLLGGREPWCSAYCNHLDIVEFHCLISLQILKFEELELVITKKLRLRWQKSLITSIRIFIRPPI